MQTDPKDPWDVPRYVAVCIYGNEPGAQTVRSGHHRLVRTSCLAASSHRPCLINGCCGLVLSALVAEVAGSVRSLATSLRVVSCGEDSLALQCQPHLQPVPALVYVDESLGERIFP